VLQDLNNQTSVKSVIAILFFWLVPKFEFPVCSLLGFVTCVFMLFEKTLSLLEKTIELNPR